MNSDKVKCGHRIHDLILQIYDHGTSPAYLSRSSIYSKQTQVLVRDMMKVVSRAYSGVPCGRFLQFCSQFADIPDDFIEMLSLRIVIDSTRDKIFSKYLKEHAIGEVITKPEDIRVYLNAYIRKSHHFLD